MANAVPDSCCKSYEPKCAQKPYGKHPSNIFYKVDLPYFLYFDFYQSISGLFVNPLQWLSYTFDYSWLCNNRRLFSSSKQSFFFCIEFKTKRIVFEKMFTIVLLIWLLRRIQKLVKLKTSNPSGNKLRRLSNEITYYPMQSSVK